MFPKLRRHTFVASTVFSLAICGGLVDAASGVEADPVATPTSSSGSQLSGDEAAPAPDPAVEDGNASPEPTTTEPPAQDTPTETTSPAPDVPAVPDPEHEAIPDVDAPQSSDPVGIAAQSAAQTPTAFPAIPLAVGTVRASGQDRYGTAVAISRRLFPEGSTAPAVFLASGTSYADGLTLGALASFLGGPLLLTPTNAVPPAVLDEIDRLKPSRIVIAGGPDVVSDAVLQVLQTRAPDVQRIGGIDRYETARLIASEFPQTESVFLATGLDYPDALVASTASSRAPGGFAPILLSRGFAADPALLTALTALSPKQIYMVGGTWSAADKTAIAAASGGQVKTLNGLDRYETSALVGTHFWGSGPTSVIYSTGLGYADAMAGIPAGSAFDAPILLTRTNCRPEVVAAVAKQQSKVLLLGGPDVLAQGIEKVTCPVGPVLAPKVTMQNGYYRFSMAWSGQETNYWCGPATGYMILSRLGWGTSVRGTGLSQAALASNSYMETERYERTAWAYNMFAVGMNRWMGWNAYQQQHAPSAQFFRDRVNESFTSRGIPMAVDTQEWANGAHYNNHPRTSFSHIMAIEGYNPASDTLLMLDPAAHYYYWNGASNLFGHNLGSFTAFVQDFGIYY